MKRITLIFLFISLFSSIAFAGKKRIALTIDDLPFVGAGKNAHLDLILETLIQNNIPATGFVIAGHIMPSDWPLLHKFRDSGFSLGNHTYSHANLNKLSIENYIQEIDMADKILQPVLSEPKYFRFPYLATGKGPKQEEILNHLFSKNYQIAPITIDSKDFIFNQLLLSLPEKKRLAFFNLLKPSYIEYIRQQTELAESTTKNKTARTQILLIHANLLNAYALPDLIQFYKQHGYDFISLEEALESTKKPQKVAYKKPKMTISLLQKLESWVDWD